MINALVAKDPILIKYWFEPVLCICSPRDALIRAFIETDSSFRHELDVERKFKKGGGTDWHPGCTATTALLVHDKLFVANAGDCRTIICRKGMAIPLSKVPVLVLSLTYLYCAAAEISWHDEHLGLTNCLDCELFSCAHEGFKAHWTWELCVKSLKRATKSWVWSFFKRIV